MENQEENKTKKDHQEEDAQRIPDHKGTGLYDLAEAIGGAGGRVIGDDNPGREENISRKDIEIKTPE